MVVENRASSRATTEAVRPHHIRQQSTTKNLPQLRRDCAKNNDTPRALFFRRPVRLPDNRARRTEGSKMRIFVAILLAASAFGARPSEAQYAAQLYPYCSLSSSSGATNCYIRSREECGRN